MKERTRSELEQAIATGEGMLKGIRVAKQQQLERLGKTIASAESILDDLKMRKKQLQKDIEDLTSTGH